MQEIAKKEVQAEEQLQEDSAESAPVEKREVDPYEERSRIQAEKAKAAELKAKALELEREAQARQDAIDHRISTALVNELFNKHLTAFEKDFTQARETKTTSYAKYLSIQKHIAKTQEYDRDFPNSLSKGKYSDVVNMQDKRTQFWAHYLPSIASGQLLLHKFLLQSLNRSESPLVRTEK